MRKTFFYLITIIISLLFISNISSASAATTTTCQYCPDSVYKNRVDNATPYEGLGGITQDDRYVCVSDQGGLDVKKAAEDNSCTWDSGKCDAKIGCTEGPQPSQCNQKDKNCQDESDCGNLEGNCANYYCMSGPYRVQNGQLDGKCKFNAEGDPGFPPGAGDICIVCTGINSHYDPLKKTCFDSENHPDPDHTNQLECDPFTETCSHTKGCITTGSEGEPNESLSSPCKNPGDDGCSKIETALGPISTSSAEFTKWLLSFVLGISGGIVVLIIIISGYRLMTSQGEPEKVKNARDQLTAAVIGLLFIIFSLVILEFITSDILGLPGFGG